MVIIQDSAHLTDFDEITLSLLRVTFSYVKRKSVRNRTLDVLDLCKSSEFTKQIVQSKAHLLNAFVTNNR